MHGIYPLTLFFDYPGAGRETLASWQVDVQDAKGTTVRRWIGEIGVPNQHAHYVVNWDGRDTSGLSLTPGF